MKLHETAIKTFQANRRACLAGSVGLAIVVILLLVFGIDYGGLKAPEDSAALKKVHAVSLAEIRQTKTVPTAYVKRIDVDLAPLTAAERKQAFFRIVMPLVARENDRIRAERKAATQDASAVPSKLYERYKVKPGDLKALRRRVDIIPASLVLAQAALESGWGTSRFALDGNNLFGMRTYDEDTPGLSPSAAKGFKVMHFDSLGDSVAAYMLNLNTHHAYQKLRGARAHIRSTGTQVTGNDLTAWLTNYSEIPEKYGRMLRGLIEREKLTPFDNVKLSAKD